MCRKPCQEKVEYHINPPDDDTEDFGRVLEYLYAKGYGASDLEGLRRFERLASTYLSLRSTNWGFEEAHRREVPSHLHISQNITNLSFSVVENL